MDDIFYHCVLQGFQEFTLRMHDLGVKMEDQVVTSQIN